MQSTSSVALRLGYTNLWRISISPNFYTNQVSESKVVFKLFENFLVYRHLAIGQSRLLLLSDQCLLHGSIYVLNSGFRNRIKRSRVSEIPNLFKRRFYRANTFGAFTSNILPRPRLNYWRSIWTGNGYYYGGSVGFLRRTFLSLELKDVSAIDFFLLGRRRGVWKSGRYQIVSLVNIDLIGVGGLDLGNFGVQVSGCIGRVRVEGQIWGFLIVSSSSQALLSKYRLRSLFNKRLISENPIINCSRVEYQVRNQSIGGGSYEYYSRGRRRRNIALRGVPRMRVLNTNSDVNAISSIYPAHFLFPMGFLSYSNLCSLSVSNVVSVEEGLSVKLVEIIIKKQQIVVNGVGGVVNYSSGVVLMQRLEKSRVFLSVNNMINEECGVDVIVRGVWRNKYRINVLKKENFFPVAQGSAEGIDNMEAVNASGWLCQFSRYLYYCERNNVGKVAINYTYVSPFYFWSRPNLVRRVSSGRYASVSSSFSMWQNYIDSIWPNNSSSVGSFLLQLENNSERLQRNTSSRQFPDVERFLLWRMSSNFQIFNLVSSMLLYGILRRSSIVSIQSSWFSMLSYYGSNNVKVQNSISRAFLRASNNSRRARRMWIKDMVVLICYASRFNEVYLVVWGSTYFVSRTYSHNRVSLDFLDVCALLSAIRLVSYRGFSMAFSGPIGQHARTKRWRFKTGYIKRNQFCIPTEFGKWSVNTFYGSLGSRFWSLL